ncbi:unnamed protein product [Lota lota]
MEAESFRTVSALSSPSHDELNVNSEATQGLRSPTAVFLDGKISTPYEMHQKHRVVVSFEQSLIDVSASQLQWNLSLIKPDTGPHPYVESTTLESTLSPPLHSAPLSLVEIPSPIWQDASPKRA